MKSSKGHSIIVKGIVKEIHNKHGEYKIMLVISVLAICFSN